VKGLRQLTLPYSSPCLHFQPQRQSVAQPVVPQVGQPANQPTCHWSFHELVTKRQPTHFHPILLSLQPKSDPNNDNMSNES
jgi:hypothetical protein